MKKDAWSQLLRLTVDWSRFKNEIHIRFRGDLDAPSNRRGHVDVRNESWESSTPYDFKQAEYIMELNSALIQNLYSLRVKYVSLYF